MAITARAAGTWAVSNATTQQVTIPGGVQSGDMMLLLFSQKDATTIPQTITVDQGWTVVGSYTNGTTTAGNGTGSNQTGIAYKVHSGSETNPTITWGGTSAPGVAVIVAFQRSSGNAWLVAGDGGGGITSTTSSYSQASASNEGVTAGDMVVAVLASRDDTAWTVPTFTQTGVTYGTATVYPTTPIADATSNDISATAVYRSASSGTSSAAKTVTGTLAAVEWASHYGVRLREATATTYQGSVTADATILKVQQGSVTADAYVMKVGESSVTADAYINKMFEGSVTADAYISKAYEGSVTADAYILKVTEGSVTADAYIFKTTSGSVTADSYILVVQTGSVTADSYIFKTTEGSVTADAYVNAIQTGSVTADAEIAEAPATGPTWVSPADGVTIGATPTFVFTPQSFTGNKHFHMELCQVNTFNDGTLRSMKTNIAQAGWEYWNGSQWTAFPSTGMPDTYSGNNVRHTVQTALASGVWYRRVRAGG